MRRVGLTIGKFMPLHKGHELMIEFGSKMLDELVVVISGKSNDEISIAKRCNWVDNFVRRKGLDNITVWYHVDKSPTPINIDENGTVLDADFQLYWANEFSKIAPRATHIVSSDKYGQVIAKRMGLKWLPVDSDREMVQICATQIRKDPVKYFKYISEEAKPFYVKKVAIVGPESTGKSTMVKSLSRLLNCSIANEYGRTLSEAKVNDIDDQDFMDITYGQQHLIDIAVRRAETPLVITDTEAITTYLFSKTYLGSLKKEILDFASHNIMDLYVVLAPNVNWVDDGTRVLGAQADRQRFFEDMIQLLKLKDRNYVVVDETDFAYRTAQATKAIYEHIKS